MDIASLSREEIITYISGYPEKLKSITAKLSKEQLAKTRHYPESEWVIDGKWSIQQVLHHIADAHMNKFFQIRHMLTEDNPQLIEYSDWQFPSFADGYDADIKMSQSILTGLHARVTILLKSLDNEKWKKPGTHPKKGLTNIEGVARTFVSHGNTHFEQLNEVLNSK